MARHLGWYLSERERKASFAQLLLDFRWLEARLRSAGFNALLSDWTGLDSTPAVEALKKALLHGAHVLGHEGGDWNGLDLLASQILGRLQHRAESEIRSLCTQAAEQALGKGALRPLAASLQSSDALLSNFGGHTDGVMALAALPDGRLVSGSDDKSVRIWDSLGYAPKGSAHFVADAAITALAIAPDASVLAVGDMSGLIHFLKIEGVPSASDARQSPFDLKCRPAG